MECGDRGAIPSNLHFFRYATTTGSDDRADPSSPPAASVNAVASQRVRRTKGWGLELTAADHENQTGERVPFNRADGLGLSYRADDDARFYTWIWHELVDRGLLELLARFPAVA